MDGEQAIREWGLDLESVARRVLRIYESALIPGGATQPALFPDSPFAPAAPMRLVNGR
jgi:hypothetical protein